MLQAYIAITSLAAVYLVNKPDPLAQKAAPIVGLLAQPGWIISTAAEQQWGMLLLSFAYTGVWGLSAWRLFRR